MKLSNWKPSPTAKWVLAFGLVSALGASISWNPAYFSVARQDYVGTGSYADLAATDPNVLVPIDLGKITGMKKLEKVMIHVLKGDDNRATFIVVEKPKSDEGQAICYDCFGDRGSVQATADEIKDGKVYLRIADSLLAKGEKKPAAEKVAEKTTDAKADDKPKVEVITAMAYDSKLCEKNKSDKTVSEILECQKTQLNEVLEECKNLYDAADEAKKASLEKKCALTARKYFENEIEDVLRKGMNGIYSEVVSMPIMSDYDSPYAYQAALRAARIKNTELQKMQKTAHNMRKEILDVIGQIPRDNKAGKDAVNDIGKKISGMTEKSLEEGAAFFYDYKISMGLNKDVAAKEVNDWVRAQARRGGVTNQGLRRALTALNDQQLINRYLQDDLEIPLSNYDINIQAGQIANRSRNDVDARSKGRTNLRYGFTPNDVRNNTSNYPAPNGGYPTNGNQTLYPWQQPGVNTVNPLNNYPTRQ